MKTEGELKDIAMVALSLLCKGSPQETYVDLCREVPGLRSYVTGLAVTDPRAFDVIGMVAADYIENNCPLPDDLRLHVIRRLEGVYMRPGGQGRFRNRWRDAMIFGAVALVMERGEGIKRTRNDYPSRKVSVSACDIVANALRDIGYERVGYEEVEKISEGADQI